MTKPHINIVWLKRDLRTQDHEPLQLAEEDGRPYLILFCFEPSLYNYPDTSLRHLQFQYHSVVAMNRVLEKYGKSVVVAHADGESGEPLGRGALSAASHDPAATALWDGVRTRQFSRDRGRDTLIISDMRTLAWLKV